MNDPYGEIKSSKKKGGRIQPNSGRSTKPSQKGDFKAGNELFDRKETKHSSYTLTVETYNKIFMEAVTIGRNPALEIFFKQHGITLVIIQEERYRELIDIEEREKKGTDRSSLGKASGNRKEKIGNIIDSINKVS